MAETAARSAEQLTVRRVVKVYIVVVGEQKFYLPQRIGWPGFCLIDGNVSLPQSFHIVLCKIVGVFLYRERSLF